MALALPMTVTILTPATSANLGPGFDSLGLALQLYNRFNVEEWEGDPLLPNIEVQGALGESLSVGPDNLFFRSFALLFERLGVPVPSVRIRMTINIPPGCGLGSSATAVVGGLVAANEWV
jgi:homoserine kinase